MAAGAGGAGGAGGAAGIPEHQQHQQYQQQQYQQPSSFSVGIGGGGGSGGASGRHTSFAPSSHAFRSASASSSTVSSTAEMFNKFSATVSSAIPRKRVSLATRILLVATFFEDGVRVITDLPGQARFLRVFYHIPMWLGVILLLAMVSFSIGASLVVVAASPRAHTVRERASYALIVHIFIQQALYGRDAPATGGNLSFLMRNFCLAGSFLMVACHARLRKGASALPGILGGLGGSSSGSGGHGGGHGGPSHQRALEYMQLASRIMLVLLPLEFVSSLGFIGTVLAVPVMLAVLAGYRTQWSGGALLAFYALHNLLTSAFWNVKDRSPVGQYSRDVKQYEFVQTVSIMGGVLMLVVEGPGALSVDAAQRKD